MRSKVSMQVFVAVVVFFTLVWFINSKASSVDWEHVFVLRVAILGLLSISLMIWSTKNQGSFRKTVEHKWFGYTLGFAVVALLFYVYVRPWVNGKYEGHLNEVVQMQAKANAEYARAHADTETEMVATENNPVRIITRAFERVLISPVGYVSYKVMYPSPVDSSLITVIRKRESKHVDLPPTIKWAEYRPLDTDSIIFTVRRHVQR